MNASQSNKLEPIYSFGKHDDDDFFRRNSFRDFLAELSFFVTLWPNVA